MFRSTSGNIRSFARVFPSATIPHRMRSFHMRATWLILGIGMALASHATVLDPPELRCAGFAPGGDIALNWVPTTDPTGEFLRYDIMYSTAQAGPYALLASVNNLAATGWTGPVPGSAAAAIYFHVTSVSVTPPPNTSVPSDTLATVFLEVGQSTPLGGAQLNWNVPHLPPLATHTPIGVYLEYPIGTLTFLTDLPLTQISFQYPIAICEDTMAFVLSYTDASGCTANSRADGAIFQDVTPPSIPEIAQVSVDTLTDQTVVTWLPSPEPDTDGYIIVLVDDAGNVVLDTIQGQFNNSYVWPGSQSDLGSEAYTVAAIDTCWSGMPPHPNTSATYAPHRTVFTRTDYDPCAGTISVEWTPYVGWPVGSYTVYVMVDGGAPQALVSQSGAGINYGIVHTVQAFRTYCYVVVADGATPAQHSLSNKACVPADYANIPQWNYLRVATVEAPDHVVVVDSVDLSARARRYRLERSANGGEWEEVASQPGGTAPVVVFHDHEVETDKRSYLYRVQVEDTCGHRVLTSNLGGTVFLTVEAGLDGWNELRWNGYVQWAGNVHGYAIHRSVEGGPFELIAMNPPDQWSYRDDARPFLGTNGRFCYYVEALEMGNASGFNAVSTSNPFCAVQQEQVWIPNAFIAGGYNEVFRPVLAYAAADQYELVIYNRWGQEIWRTNDPAQAWDGRVEGTFVPQGMYAYYCGFLNGDAKRVERRGTVTFLWGAP